jgi:hypothetical protein
MGVPTNELNLAPGADAVADRVAVERQFLPAVINTATTTTVKTGSGLIGEITVIGGTLGAIQVFDNTAGSGTILLPSFTPGAGTQGLVLLRDVVFNTGLTIVTAAATIITVSYR